MPLISFLDNNLTFRHRFNSIRLIHAIRLFVLSTEHQLCRSGIILLVGWPLTPYPFLVSKSDSSV